MLGCKTPSFGHGGAGAKGVSGKAAKGGLGIDGGERNRLYVFLNAAHSDSTWFEKTADLPYVRPCNSLECFEQNMQFEGLWPPKPLHCNPDFNCANPPQTPPHLSLVCFTRA